PPAGPPPRACPSHRRYGRRSDRSPRNVLPRSGRRNRLSLDIRRFLRKEEDFPGRRSREREAPRSDLWSASEPTNMAVIRARREEPSPETLLVPLPLPPLFPRLRPEPDDLFSIPVGHSRKHHRPLTVLPHESRLKQ